MARKPKASAAFRQTVGYAKLGAYARFILFDMLELAGPRQQRPLAYSARMAMKATGAKSRTTASAAIKELEFGGFIIAVKRGEFRKQGVATLWRLTMLPYRDDEPTHDYFQPAVALRVLLAEQAELRKQRARRVKGRPFFEGVAAEIYFAPTP